MKYLQSPFSFIDKVIESPFTQEFVYLNPRGPFDLQIVRHSEINPRNYCTMSRGGLTHFFNNETEFTSLDQWEREYFLYVKVTDIHFFKKYRAWKAYYYWKKLINKMKSTKYSKYLHDNLYILNRHLRDALIHLRRLCVDAARWNVLRIDAKSVLTVTQFRQVQDAQRESVAAALAKLLAEAARVVLAACDSDLKQFLIECGFRKGNDNADGGNGNNSNGGNSAAAGVNGSMSLTSNGRGATALLAAVGGAGINSGGALANPGLAHDTYSHALTATNSNSSSGLGALAGFTGGAAGAGARGGNGGGDEGQKISRAEKAAQRTKCRKLARFIRLADFRVTYTLVTLCHDRVAEMLTTLAHKHAGPVPAVELAAEVVGTIQTLGAAGSAPTGPAGSRYAAAAAAAAAASAASAAGGAGAGAGAVAGGHAVAAVKRRRAFGGGGGAGGDKPAGEAPLFLVEIEMDEQTGDLSFSPTLEELQHALEQVIDSAATQLLSHQSFVRDEQFAEYVVDMVQELTEVESQEIHPVELVLDDARMIRAKDAIRASLASAYAVITDYAAGFQRYVAQFLDNQVRLVSLFNLKSRISM